MHVERKVGILLRDDLRTQTGHEPVAAVLQMSGCVRSSHYKQNRDESRKIKSQRQTWKVAERPSGKTSSAVLLPLRGARPDVLRLIRPPGPRLRRRRRTSLRR